MTNRNTILLIAVLLSVCSLRAQQLLGGASEYRYDDAHQLWRHTDNAAALGVDTMRARGYAQMGFQHRSGDYSRVQEGKRTNQLRFETERYQPVGKYLYGYGRFDFDYGRTQERAWCDVRRPYHSDPFFPGSAIPGRYDFQDFHFVAALGTREIGRWHVGLRLDYDAGDLSRLRDPRSRSQLLEYKLTPSATYSLGRSTVGLSANYHRRKEKIIGVTTLQTDATIEYYTMSGLENAVGTVAGYNGYSREWVDHRFGTALSYAYKTDGYSLLASATVERGAESVLGQYEFEEGKFVDYRYGITVRNRIAAGRLLHELDASFGYEQAYADEYRQQYKVEHDNNVQSRDYTYLVRQDDGTLKEETATVNRTSDYTSYYYTNLLTFKKRYQVEVLNSWLHYRLNLVDDRRILGYVGTALAACDAKDSHLLPSSSLHCSNYDLSVEGGYGLLGGRLWIDGSVMRRFSGKANLSLNDATTDYAALVLIPDMDYYRANCWQGSIAILYQQPLTLKGHRTLWFAKAFGCCLNTDNSLNSRSVGLSIGLYY